MSESKCARCESRKRRPECRLFVGNLSYAATKDEVRSLFSKVGRVTDVFFPGAKPDEGKVNAGFAFVELSMPEEATRALAELNGTDGPFGRKIYVKPATLGSK